MSVGGSVSSQACVTAALMLAAGDIGAPTNYKLVYLAAGCEIAAMRSETEGHGPKQGSNHCSASW
jgi:hypothetical protein